MADHAPDAQFPTLRLKRNEDRRLHAGHLWIFSNEVDTGQTALNKFRPGEIVRVLAHNDRALGLAYVNPNSLIAARLLNTFRQPDAAWFAERFQCALVLRERLYAQPYYRLVHGESDALPGLIIDRYGSAFVVQIGTAGMEALKADIQTALQRLSGCEAVVFKNDSSARGLEGLPSYVEVSEVSTGRIDELSWVIEDNLRFQVPLLSGQKTGWFFDQAANRRALVKYVRVGSRALDVFSYVGAWGVRAARAGAREVLCIDSSAAALELAASNAQINRGAIAVRKGDAFELMEELVQSGERFDTVIVDPPAFAKRRKDLPKALAAYKRLNQLAQQVTAHDGILVTCSCSYHVGTEEFVGVIAKAARAAGKHVQILEAGGQAPDHPVHPAMPETRYLKVCFCRVHDGLK